MNTAAVHYNEARQLHYAGYHGSGYDQYQQYAENNFLHVDILIQMIHKIQINYFISCRRLSAAIKAAAPGHVDTA